MHKDNMIEVSVPVLVVSLVIVRVLMARVVSRVVRPVVRVVVVVFVRVRVPVVRVATESVISSVVVLGLAHLDGAEAEHHRHQCEQKGELFGEKENNNNMTNSVEPRSKHLQSCSMTSCKFVCLFVHGRCTLLVVVNEEVCVCRDIVVGYAYICRSIEG